MSVPGAFFEVTGRESELDQIMEGIVGLYFTADIT